MFTSRRLCALLHVHGHHGTLRLFSSPARKARVSDDLFKLSRALEAAADDEEDAVPENSMTPKPGKGAQPTGSSSDGRWKKPRKPLVDTYKLYRPSSMRFRPEYEDAMELMDLLEAELDAPVKRGVGELVGDVLRVIERRLAARRRREGENGQNSSDAPSEAKQQTPDL